MGQNNLVGYVIVLVVGVIFSLYGKNTETQKLFIESKEGIVFHDVTDEYQKAIRKKPYSLKHGFSVISDSSGQRSLYWHDHLVFDSYKSGMEVSKHSLVVPEGATRVHSPSTIYLKNDMTFKKILENIQLAGHVVDFEDGIYFTAYKKKMFMTSFVFYVVKLDGTIKQYPMKLTSPLPLKGSIVQVASSESQVILWDFVSNEKASLPPNKKAVYSMADNQYLLVELKEKTTTPYMLWDSISNRIQPISYQFFMNFLPHFSIAQNHDNKLILLDHELNTINKDYQMQNYAPATQGEVEAIIGRSKDKNRLYFMSNAKNYDYIEVKEIKWVHGGTGDYFQIVTLGGKSLVIDLRKSLKEEGKKD